MLCTLPASIITGRILRKGVSFRTLILTGWVTLLVGDSLVIIWFTNTPAVAWAIIQMLVGVGQVSGIVRLTSRCCGESSSNSAEIVFCECDARRVCLILMSHLNRESSSSPASSQYKHTFQRRTWEMLLACKSCQPIFPSQQSYTHFTM